MMRLLRTLLPLTGMALIGVTACAVPPETASPGSSPSASPGSSPSASPASPATSAAAGENGAAVDLTLRSADGQTLALADLRGKVVIVDVFATWCGPCVKSIPHLARLSERRPDDLAVLGLLTGDEPSALARLEQRVPIPYFVGIEDAAAARTFPARALPTVYVVDRDGAIVDRIVGAIPEQRLWERAARHF